MLLISTYQDLIIEIDIYKNRLEDLERESYAINRLVEGNKIDLDLYINRKCKMDNESAILQAMIDDKLETKNALLEKLKELKGLEYKIAYKRFIEGKSLNVIAEEIKYSESHIKKKSAKVGKRVNF